MSCMTIYVGDLFIVVNVCVESATPLGTEGSYDNVQQILLNSAS